MHSASSSMQALHPAFSAWDDKSLSKGNTHDYCHGTIIVTTC
jgi:hypothetical protein